MEFPRRGEIHDCTTHLIPEPVATFRAETARANWEQGHVLGAGYMDLIGDLSEPASPYRFT